MCIHRWETWGSAAALHQGRDLNDLRCDRPTAQRESANLVVISRARADELGAINHRRIDDRTVPKL